MLVGRVEEHEPDGFDDLAATGAQVIRVPGLGRGLSPGADGRALRRILGHVRARRPDVVHTHMAKAGAIGRTAAFLARVPAVHTFHGHHLQAPWPRDRLACGAERALSYLTAAAVCLTPRQRRDLCEIHRPVHRSKVAVVGPGLDVEALRAQVSPDAVAAIRRRWRRADRPLFLWAGRFVDVKDPLMLVRAVAASDRRYTVVMVGDGPLRRTARAWIEAEGLGDVIGCPGAVSELAPWLAAADAVVLSSRSEGAPLVVLEAKVLGRPAVVTAVGGVPDLVQHGVDGWWVPPDSGYELARALDALAEDPGLLRRLGEAAARDVEARFGRDRLAEDTIRIYERVVASSG